MQARDACRNTDPLINKSSGGFELISRVYDATIVVGLSPISSSIDCIDSVTYTIYGYVRNHYSIATARHTVRITI